LHIFISGFVQGVGFRYFAWYRAQKLGISGFVRNTEDDCVEIAAEGEEESLNEFLEIIKQGPGSAVIKKVSANWLEANGEFSSFRIAY